MSYTTLALQDRQAKIALSTAAYSSQTTQLVDATAQVLCARIAARTVARAPLLVLDTGEHNSKWQPWPRKTSIY